MNINLNITRIFIDEESAMQQAKESEIRWKNSSQKSPIDGVPTAIKDLLYTKDHEWISIEGDIATIGITDYAQSELGDIVFIELPDNGTKIKAT